MKKNAWLINTAIIVVAISPLIFLAIVFKNLPDAVPVHYDLNLEPDRLDNKNSLWLSNGILSAVSLIVYLLLLNLHRIDPKRKNKTPAGQFKKIAIIAVVFLSALNFLLLLSVNKNISLSPKLLLVLLGLLIAFIGNYMNNIKPNYFAGIRLPWTLSSDYNWKKTHQLAGKLWFWGGLLVAVVSLALPSALSTPVFLIFTGIIIVIPIMYSYKIFREEKINSL